LSRAVAILRTLAGPRAHGLALTEISKQADLPHPTTLRLLRHMQRLGLVHINERNRTYILGPLAFELGLAAAAHFDIRDVCQEPMQRLAKKFGDVVYVVQRSGYDAVCIGRTQGPFGSQVITLEPGSRRPLGVGAGGLAILMALPDPEAQEVISYIAPRLHEYLKLSADELLQWVRKARENGYAFSRNHVTAGVTGVGVPVYNVMGIPFASITIACTNVRINSEKEAAIVRALREESTLITSELRVLLSI
jgi:DNA-binding IclR family transcriptional regulator